jgi:hypothetical protein
MNIQPDCVRLYQGLSYSRRRKELLRTRADRRRAVLRGGSVELRQTARGRARRGAMR